MTPEELKMANMYIDGELGGAELAAFEARLRTEPNLREYVDDLRELAGEAQRMETFKAPAVRLGGVRWHPPWPLRLSAGSFLAGAALAAACVLVFTGAGSRPDRPRSATPSLENLRMTYYAPEAGSVAVLGDFNGWSAEIPFKQRGRSGYWSAVISVEPGEYRYVLLVDGVERVSDPLADYYMDDDFGSKNSVVRIGL